MIYIYKYFKLIEAINNRDKMIELVIPQALTVDQLKALSTNQANAVTDVQYKALTADRQKILDSKASVVFSSHVTSTSQPKDDGHNGKSGYLMESLT